MFQFNNREYITGIVGIVACQEDSIAIDGRPMKLMNICGSPILTNSLNPPCWTQIQALYSISEHFNVLLEHSRALYSLLAPSLGLTSRIQYQRPIKIDPEPDFGLFL